MVINLNSLYREPFRLKVNKVNNVCARKSLVFLAGWESLPGKE